MAPKKCRPATSHFAARELVDEWANVLKLRDPGFKWDGSSYQGKGASIHVDSLKSHEAGLVGLLKVAPSGFPSHTDLRSALAHLQVRHGILADDKLVTQTLSDDATEAWRLMAKHIYTLAKNPGTCVPSLRSLVAKIVLPKNYDATEEDVRASSARGSDEPEKANSSRLDEEQVAKLYDMPMDVDGDEQEDIEMLSIRCSCSECVQRAKKAKKLGTISIEDDEVVPVQASGKIPVANPKAGKQRLETKPPSSDSGASRRKKYNSKSAPRTSQEVRKPKKPKKQAKTTTKEDEQQETLIDMPIKLVHRQNGKTKPEAYLLAGGKYLAGLSYRKNANYLEDAKALKIKIEAKEVATVESARAFLKG